MPDIPEEIAAATIEEICRRFEEWGQLANRPLPEQETDEWGAMIVPLIDTVELDRVIDFLRDNRTAIIASVTRPGG